MEFKQIQELIKAINKSNISELSIEEGDFKITIRQAQAAEMQYVAIQSPSPIALPQAPSAAPAIAQAQPQAAVSTEKTVAETPQASNLVPVKSPMIGTFYRSSSPDKPSYVNVGDEIKKGQVLCIIEAMKLFNEIESEVDGTIVKVLVDDASPVEYDQPLFMVQPA